MRALRALGAVLAGAVVVGVSLAVLLGPGRPRGGGPSAAKEAAEGENEARAAPAATDRHGDLLPPGVVARIGTVRLRHGEVARCVAFSPDGKALASGSFDTTVLIWGLAPARRAALAPDDLPALWERLASPEAAAAYRAVEALAGSPAQAVPFLRERLRPPARVAAGRVARLIADLDAEDFAARERAGAELEQLGEAAEPALRKALAGRPSPEVRRRAEGVLEKLERAGAPRRLRELRAVEVLERLDTPAARELLRRLAAAGPEYRLAREADAALRRLQRPVDFGRGRLLRCAACAAPPKSRGTHSPMPGSRL